MKAPLYPLLFQPVYTSDASAGGMLAEFLRHREDLPAHPISSWECADTPQAVTTIANGPARGELFSDLVRNFPVQIVGRRHKAGKPFPLSVRLVDISRRTPLMMHPLQTVKLSHGKTAGPNNKFWFVLGTINEGSISVGIKMGVTGMQVLQHLGSPELENLLQQFYSRAGDSFFIPNQRLHSAGAGNLFWELQEQPAEPLLLCNWYDADASEISIEEQQKAIEHTSFQDRQVARISREAGVVTHNRKIPLMHHCPEFAIDEIRLHDHRFDRTDGTSFHLLSVTDGAVTIKHKNEMVRLQKGGVACIPAASGDYRMDVENDRTASFLRVTMQNF